MAGGGPAGAAGGTEVPPAPGQLRMAVLRLSRRLRQQGVGDDTTPSQLSALHTVAQHGEMSLGELAALERVAPPSMTRIAARLEERGWVDRRVDAADRRVSRVVLTDAGAELLERTRERRDLWLAERMQELSEGERAALAAAVPVLERLAREG